MSVFEQLLGKLEQQRANYLVLIDPDQKNDGHIPALVEGANRSGADAILVGGSLMMDDQFEERMARIKADAEIPVILFPGGVSQVTRHVDAMLFMSLLSGRNAQYLIGEQVRAAPLVKQIGVETIPTGYLLFSGGKPTTVEFMSNSQPLPMERADLAISHCLAAQYLGMSVVYLEAGSGAERSIPEATISAIAGNIDIPLIVGGGIRSTEVAAAKVQAGAKFIVTGTILEQDGDISLMQAFADAVHKGAV